MRKVGSGKFTYEEIKGWGQFPSGWTAKDVPAVAVDSQDRVYAFTRNKEGDCVVIFSPEGNFIASWGEGLFSRPHALFIDADDHIYCVDDWAHAVHKFTSDGKLLMTIETADHPADTGYVLDHPDTVLRSGPPFNYPTWIAQSPDGDLYVTDGYGNARVHKFTNDGELLFSWGEPGDGPGQFNCPHCVCVDKTGLVYIADRFNLRIQVFTPEGEFLDQWQGVRRPDDMCLDADGNMYVAELGEVWLYGSGKWYLDHNQPSARITVRDLSGNILTEWGEEDPQGEDLYYSPHGIAIDSQGNVFVGEVGESASFGRSEVVRPGLRKYVRI